MEVVVFYRTSASQRILSQWVREILDWITPESPDRSSLDLITTTEVLDLTYLEGEELASCIAANALIPSHVEQNELFRGLGANSSMSILFPVRVEQEQWGYEIQLRAGLPSMLAIGQGGISHVPILQANLPMRYAHPALAARSTNSRNQEEAVSELLLAHSRLSRKHSAKQ